LKQRVYGLGVPLAVKLGNMDKRAYIAAGAEGEYFFNYKIKYYINKEKHKSNTWFPDQVNAFNPSLFLEYRMKSGLYFRAKYYLLDFLTSQAATKLTDSISVPGYSATSKLFYISFGLNIKTKKGIPKPTLKQKPATTARID